MNTATILRDTAPASDGMSATVYREPMEFCRRYVPRAAEGVAIDAGCGVGAQTAYFASRGLLALGLDIDAKKLARAKRRANGANRCDFVRGDLQRLPFADGCADVVFSRGTLQYVQRDRSIDELLRILKTGGTLVLIQNMPHNPIIGLYRVLRRLPFLRLADREYVESIRGYVTRRELRELSRKFRTTRTLDSHLLRPLTLPLLARNADRRLVVALDRGIAFTDRALLRWIRPLRRFTWVTTTIYEGKY